MGIAYILTVYDDGVRDAKHNPSKYRTAVGDAVLSVCRPHMDSPPPVAPVLNHTNCVKRVGEQHSTWQQVYLWQANCLRAVHELSLDELAVARQIIDEALAERKGQEQ